MLEPLAGVAGQAVHADEIGHGSASIPCRYRFMMHSRAVFGDQFPALHELSSAVPLLVGIEVIAVVIDDVIVRRQQEARRCRRRGRKRCPRASAAYVHDALMSSRGVKY